MKRWGLVISLLVLVSSCKKEPLPDLPDANSPYYSVRGYIDGEHIDLNVGQEGIHISHGIDEMNGITTYYGQIISLEEDLRIRIDFTRPEIMLASSGITAFDMSNLGFLVHQQGCKSMSFGSNTQQENYVEVADGSGLFNQQSEISFDEYGMYDVSFKFTDVSQTAFSIPVSYGFNDMQLNTGFSTSANQDTTVFTANDPGLEHEWYIDSDLLSTEASFGVSLSTGIHKVEHKVRDVQENAGSYTTLVRISNMMLDWQLALNSCSGSSQVNSNYGKAIVTVWKNGEEYRSDHLVDNLSNSFAIKNVEYVGYDNLPDRAAFDFDFGALLINENSGDSLSLSGMTGTFNIGLK